MDDTQIQEQNQNYSREANLLWDELIGESYANNAIEAYGVAVAECQYFDEKLRETLKELSKVKFALDQAAIVAITDCKGIIRYVNDTFCEISRYSRDELLGKDHRIINSGHHPKDFFKDFWSTVRAGKVWKGEIKNRAKDGTEYWVDTTIVPFADKNGIPYQYLAIRFDISDRKQAEESLRQSEAKFRQQAEQLELTLQDLKLTQAQLIQSAKLSSMGQMVAGIAHEINNPVNFIYGNLIYSGEYIEKLLHLLYLYQEYYPQPLPEIETSLEASDVAFLMADLPKMLTSMKVGANRIRDLVLSLRNFSRFDEAQMNQVDIHAGIDSTLLILQDRLKGKGGHQITLIKEYGTLPLLLCYPNQINQVFMNILSNAIDAVEQQPLPRIITIKTEESCANSLLVSIADNGSGIPEEVQQHLFEPFFTTKPVGKGTGLGLSIARHIVVEKHKGNLKCISHPNQGTEFLISIPISPSS